MDTEQGEVVELESVELDSGSELWFKHDRSNHGFQEGEHAWVGSNASQARKDWYLQWLLTPTVERHIKTKTAVAEFLGISRQALTNYERDPRFQKKLAKESARLRRVELADTVLNKLFERATVPDLKVPPAAANTAAKIWLDYTMGPLFQQDDLQVDFSELSDEELEEQLVKFLAVRAEMRSGS